MKVLYIINNLGSGGAEKLLIEVVPLLNQVNDFEVSVLLLTDKRNVYFDSLIIKGISVEIVKYNNLYDPRNIFEISQIINRGHFDIVHSHVFPAQYWVALSRIFLKKSSVSFVTTEHSTFNRRRNLVFFKFIDKFVYSKYDTIVSITHKTRDNLLSWIDPKKKRIHKHVVIENGVDLSLIRNALPYNKAELINGASDNIIIICMVGRFNEAKDQPTLIKTLNFLPKKVHLVLVGEGPLLESNIKLAESLNIIDRVHFLGFRNDIPNILKTVDIVILSSYWEGLSLASIEGLASNKPFIASRVPGLEEVVSGSGILFDRGDYKALSQIILNLLNDEDYYKNVAVACTLKAENYSIIKLLDNLVELYRRLRSSK